MSGGNHIPTEASVRGKLVRRGALFAADEVRVLADALDRARADRDQAVEAMRAIQLKYVRTDSA